MLRSMLNSRCWTTQSLQAARVSFFALSQGHAPQARGPLASLSRRMAASAAQGRGQQAQQGEDGAAIEAASNRHAPGLFAFWALASGGAAFAALQRGVAPDAVLLVDASFWLATACSISLMEAWVKFRAPLLERHVGVDVGRRVFRGEYATELGLALTAAGVLAAQGGGGLGGAAAALAAPGGWPLAGAAALLAAEAALVFPALDLRGKRLIAESARPAELAPRQAAYVQALRAEVARRGAPPAQLHLASVVLAFAKAGLLGLCVWQKLLLLGGGA